MNRKTWRFVILILVGAPRFVLLCFVLFFAFSLARTSPFITQSKMFTAYLWNAWRSETSRSAVSKVHEDVTTQPRKTIGILKLGGGLRDFSCLSILGDLIPTFWKCSNVHNLDDSPSISLLWDVSQFWGSAASGTQWNFFDEDFNITIF